MPTKNTPKSELDPELAKAIEREERRSGYTYGTAMREVDGGLFRQCFIDVSFYPSVKWWIEDFDGNRRVPLTLEEWNKVRRIKI